MATFVQVRGSSMTVDPVALAYNSNVVAGNMLYCTIVIVGLAVTVNSVTDSQGNTWTQHANSPYVSAGGRLYFFKAQAGASGANTVTVDCTAAPGGGSGFDIWEVNQNGLATDGASNTLAAGIAANPSPQADITTTQTGFIISLRRNTSNYTIVSWSDGFTDAASALGRAIFGYKASAPTTTNIDITFSSTESGDSFTVSMYDGAGSGGLINQAACSP